MTRYETNYMGKYIISDSDSIRRIASNKQRNRHAPSDKRVLWQNGQRGNGNCKIKDTALVKFHGKSTNSDIVMSGKEFNARMREKYGTDIVKYRNFEPDFKPFEHTFEMNGETCDGHVTIEKMSVNRGDNYKYAEETLAEQLQCSRQDIQEYMKKNNLTWHECADRHTIRAVPTEINSVYTHSGGVSEEKRVRAIASKLNTLSADNGFKNITRAKEITTDKQDSESATKESNYIKSREDREQSDNHEVSAEVSDMQNDKGDSECQSSSYEMDNLVPNDNSNTQDNEYDMMALEKSAQNNEKFDHEYDFKMDEMNIKSINESESNEPCNEMSDLQQDNSGEPFSNTEFENGENGHEIKSTEPIEDRSSNSQDVNNGQTDDYEPIEKNKEEEQCR